MQLKKALLSLAVMAAMPTAGVVPAPIYEPVPGSFSYGRSTGVAASRRAAKKRKNKRRK